MQFLLTFHASIFLTRLNLCQLYIASAFLYLQNKPESKYQKLLRDFFYHRGSIKSANVLLNLFNKMWKRYEMLDFCPIRLVTSILFDAKTDKHNTSK